MAIVGGKMKLNSGMRALSSYGAGNSKLCVESKNLTKQPGKDSG